MKSTYAPLLLGLALSSMMPAAPATVTTTHVYKRMGDLEIKLDVHRPDDRTIRPLAVWIHGGALINGGRQGTGPAGKALLAAGYCVVSIDYRLAPETKLPAIIEDLKDAFRWLREHGRGELAVDPDRIAVLGGSAGGYLTLTAGFRVRSRPAVLVAYWGYGDLVGDWYSKPSRHARHQRGNMTPAEMAVIEAGPPVANSRDRKGDGGSYYSASRREGSWPRRVSGFDPMREPEKISPYMAIRNVTADYPPTLLIHGTADTDVPYEQTQMMAREFERHGVPYRLITIENGEHGLKGGDSAAIGGRTRPSCPLSSGTCVAETYRLRNCA